MFKQLNKCLKDSWQFPNQMHNLPQSLVCYTPWTQDVNEGI